MHLFLSPLMLFRIVLLANLCVTLSLLTPNICRADGNDANAVPGISHAFELETLSGESVQVAASDSGITVVCFLGTECPLVQLYSVRLSAMADALRDRGVRFVAVNSNSHDAVEDIQKFLDRHPLTFPLVRDE